MFLFSPYFSNNNRTKNPLHFSPGELEHKGMELREPVALKYLTDLRNNFLRTREAFLESLEKHCQCPLGRKYGCHALCESCNQLQLESDSGEPGLHKMKVLFDTTLLSFSGFLSLADCGTP